MHFDVLVIGSGPAGQAAAVSAAKAGLRCGLIERNQGNLGGVCLHTGTIPSKTMREAILHLTGYRQRDVYRNKFRRKRHITMQSVRRKLSQVTREEMDVVYDQMERNGVRLFAGVARFVDDHTVEIQQKNGPIQVTADKIALACGSRPSRPGHIPFDGTTVFDSDEILSLDHIPRSMIVVGAGVIGIEYAIMFSILGVQVTVIDGRSKLLEFADAEIVDVLLHTCRTNGITFRLGENVDDVRHTQDGHVAVLLESGKVVIGETALFSVGRVSDVEQLNLAAAGVVPEKRGRIVANERFQTSVPHIYAVGDVIGFPALASTAKEQGREMVCHITDQTFQPNQNLPYGLFTIPEISMVGKNEQQLTDELTPYEVGIAKFHENARGRIMGDHEGMLKLLVHRDTRKLLGIHCIGENATEIIHIGQAVMSLSGTVDYFVNTVFNYPTMAEAYRVAAFDAIRRIAEVSRVEVSRVEASPVAVTPVEPSCVATTPPATPPASEPGGDMNLENATLENIVLDDVQAITDLATTWQANLLNPQAITV